jgi:hypothetical protein
MSTVLQFDLFSIGGTTTPAYIVRFSQFWPDELLSLASYMTSSRFLVIGYCSAVTLCHILFQYHPT